MTTDKIWVRILTINDCGTENFLNVFIPVTMAKVTMHFSILQCNESTLPLYSLVQTFLEVSYIV